MLLTFKGFVYHPDKKFFAPATCPEWEWPGADIEAWTSPIIQSKCRHIVPDENCTCGVYSSSSIDYANEYANAPSTEGMIYLPMIIQALGKTIKTGTTLRSWGAYLWGIVYSPKLSDKMWETIIDRAWNKYPPGLVRYSSVAHAAREMSEYFKSGVKYDKILLGDYNG